jgi:hypothetical protein
MRLHHVRFTIRRLMLVVALAGLVMGGGVRSYRTWKLSGEYTRRAQYYRQSGNMYERIVEDWQSDWPELAAQGAATAAKCAAVARTYERAARYPWLPVERDPPQP